MMDSSAKGVTYLLAGIALFSVQDVVIKSLSGVYTVHEIVFVRSLIAIWFILLIVRHEGGASHLRTRRPLAHLARSFALFVAYTTFYLGLAAMPLADVVAIAFASPLFLTALSMPLLGEPVGRRRWSAVVVGFVGVLIMLRPGSGVLDPVALLPLVSAFAYACAAIITRRLAASESGSTMALYTTLFYIVATGLIGVVVGDGSFAGSEHASLAFLLRPWGMPSGIDWALFVMLGFIAAFGFYCLSQAYRVAQPSAVAPFEYSALIWAVLWGWLFWGDLPDAYIVGGIVLVVGSGLYVLHREAMRGRRTATGRGMRPRV